jgi:hypothetical protein
MEQVIRNAFRCWRRRLRRWMRRAPAAICLAAFLGFVARLPAPGADKSVEYQVKSAFLLNFTKFIDWPAAAFAAPDSPMVICIIGEDPFGVALDQMVAGEVLEGHRLTVQRIKETPPPKSCHMLYFGGPKYDFHGLGPGVLTVGEGETFVHDGGIIGFVIENRRVRFGINQTAAENAGLTISSKLFNVARSVEK